MKQLERVLRMWVRVGGMGVWAYGGVRGYLRAESGYFQGKGERSLGSKLCSKSKWLEFGRI